MSKQQTRNIHIVDGMVYHFGAITSPGKFGDFFLPIRFSDSSLYRSLEEERLDQIEATRIEKFLDDSCSVHPQPFEQIDKTYQKLTLKWKPKDKDQPLLMDLDDTPLTKSNQELQTALVRVSFVQFPWAFEGKVGTKLRPRKLKVLEYATIDDGFDSFTSSTNDPNCDF